MLHEIEAGFSQSKMERYVGLIEKLGDRTITEAEQEEWRETTAELERLNVRRARALSQLAECRGVGLETVMKQLGIEPPDVV